MEPETPPSVPAADSAAPPQKTFRGFWLVFAALAFGAAFFFQWKNSLDQASIAQTDAGGTVRAKIEESAPDGIRVFYEGPENFSEILLCDGDGNALCALERAPDDPEFFRFPPDAPREKIAEERFWRFVVPALKSDGKPVVLVVRNVF